MFKKRVLSLLLIAIGLLLFGCSSSDPYDQVQGDDGQTQEFNVTTLAIEDMPERLIIYTVNISFDVEDLDLASNTLKSLIETDEWFDSESITSTVHAYTIRIRTTRLDTFIDDLKDEFTLRTYKKEGTDISVAYQDMGNQILALQAQLDRLLVLYESASLSDMITINAQISEIEVELQSLQGEINEFDSLVEYSEVYLNFYGSTVTTKSPFFNRLANGFLDGLNALVSFLDGLIIVIVTASPFLIIFGGVGVGVYVIFEKRRKRKIKDKETNKKE